MRDILDCGILLAPGHEAAMREWVGRHFTRVSRLRLHLVSLSPLRYSVAAAATEHAVLESSASPCLPVAPGTPAAEAPAHRDDPDVGALARLAVALRRYDACVLPVAPTSLAWTRMALQQACPALVTPIVLLVQDVKAPAIEDLLSLGASDFMMQPACLESMRVRLSRLGRPAAYRGNPSVALREPVPAYSGPERHSGSVGVHGAGGASGASGVGRPGALRPRVAPELVEQALTGLRHQYRRPVQEPFRVAKARVVDGFECDYIRLALSRHGGNVAQAARACSKHRRAFWALMRKHGIEAAPYRQAAQDRDD